MTIASSTGTVEESDFMNFGVSVTKRDKAMSKLPKSEKFNNWGFVVGLALVALTCLPAVSLAQTYSLRSVSYTHLTLPTKRIV